MTAPEPLLARTIAQLLAGWDLALYDPDAPLVERSTRTDGEVPTTIQECTVITALPTVFDGRADALYRVQVFTRRTGNLPVVQEWAHALHTRLHNTEYTPNILGIAFASETSRLYFDPDTQKRSAVAVTYAFRGRRAA